MATTEKAATFVGTSQLRKEDPELVTGRGTFVDNISLQGMLWVGVVRSPFAHAKINSIDVSKALALEGVVAAYTAADLEFAAPLLMAWAINDQVKNPPHNPLTKDKARYVGDAVAVVVAESRALAKDAGELVEVDWEPLPAVVGIKEALAPDAPLVHEEFGTNDAGSWSIEGDSPVPRRAPTAPFFEDPDLVKIKEEYYLGRLIPNAIEPRGVVVEPNIPMGEFTVYSATQIPHILRTALDDLDRHPGGEAACRRARRRRRLRLEARGLPGGRHLPRAGAEARPAGEVDRGAFRELRRHAPRAGDVPGDRARGDARRRPEGRAGEAHRRDGCVSCA